MERRAWQADRCHRPRLLTLLPKTGDKDQYAGASICGNKRVVFNVGGNKYRLVVEVQYQAGIVWVKFVGTHAQYDRIDVESVNDY